MKLQRLLLLAAFAVMPAPLIAQADSTARTQIGPPIQRITTASALSTEMIGTITGVRELADGRVLLNDGTRRRLLLMDTTLQVVNVVLDSLSEIANTYGVRAGALLPFRGDSVLFVDPASYAIVVLDPEGRFVRVRSVWRVEHVNYVASLGFGVPGIDAKGRIIYRIPATPAPPLVPPPSGVPYFPPNPDSAFIVGVNIDTRKIDTLGVVRIPKQEMRVRQTVGSGFSIDMVTNPLPMTDDWAVLSDGTIAFVRGLDYRVDYLNPDGTRTSSEKLAYEWQRMLDADKQRMIDSVKAVQLRSATNNYVAGMIRWVNMYKQKYPPNFTVPQGFVAPPGLARDWVLPPGLTLPENYIYACPPGVEPSPTAMTQIMTAMGAAQGGGVPVTVQGGNPVTVQGAQQQVRTTGATQDRAAQTNTAGAPGAAGAPGGQPPCFPSPISISGGQVPPAPSLRQPMVMSPEELPDYRPPFTSNAVRADMDGNLWIRTIQPRPVPGGLIYDIVNRQGQLVNRLQLPPGYTLAGFGRNKVVYLSVRDASGIHLARVRLR